MLGARDFVLGDLAFAGLVAAHRWTLKSPVPASTSLPPGSSGLVLQGLRASLIAPAIGKQRRIGAVAREPPDPADDQRDHDQPG